MRAKGDGDMRQKSRQRFQKRTIKSLIVNTCIFLFLLPLALSWAALTVHTNVAMIRSAIDNRKAYVDLIGSVVEKELAQLNTDINALAGNDRICSILTNTNFRQYDSKLLFDFKYLDSAVIDVLGKDENVENVVIINNDGDIYSNQYISSATKQTILQNDWYQATLDLRGKTNFIGRLTNDRQQNVFAVARVVIDRNFRVIGVICIFYSEDILLSTLRNDPNQSSQIYIVSDGQDILFSTDEDSEPTVAQDLREGRDKLAGQGYLRAKVHDKASLLISSTPNVFGLQIVNSIDYATVQEERNRVQLYIVAIMLCCMLIFALCMLRFYREFSVPIKRVLAYIQQYTDGTDGQNTGMYQCYELSQLSDEVVSLVNRQQQGDRQIKTLAHEYEMATLEKLQAQMNPHFLYNTLTTIKFAALQHGEKDIAEIITALVKLMRSLISRNGAFVSVSEEIGNLENYLCIEKNIYRNQFEVNICVEEGLQDYMMPSFILQPLVENCIFHGIEPSKAGGRIRVAVSGENDRLIFEIQDNGRGMSAQTAEKVLDQGSSLTNFGISGVRKKLKLLFSEIEQPLQIFSSENKGTLIRITIPRIRRKEDAPC